MSLFWFLLSVLVFSPPVGRLQEDLVELEGPELPTYLQYKAFLGDAHDSMKAKDSRYASLLQELGIASNTAVQARLEAALEHARTDAPKHPAPSGHESSTQEALELEWLRKDMEHVDSIYRSIVESFCQSGLEIEPIHQYIEDHILPGLFGTFTPEEWRRLGPALESMQQVEACPP